MFENIEQVRKSKLYIECTHTMASGLNTGIQRVVREIIHNLPSAVDSTKYEIRTIIFDEGRFIEQVFNPIGSHKFKKTIGEHIWNFLKIAFLWFRICLGWFFPAGKIKFFITGPKYSEKTLAYFVSEYVVEPSMHFIRMSKRMFGFGNERSKASAIEVQKGDILLLLDSSWYIKFWDEIKRFNNRGGKVVNVVYDLIPITHPQFCDDFLTHVFKNYFFTSVDYVNKYICISKTVAEDLEAFFKKSIPTGKKLPEISYFHLGSDFKNKKAQSDLLNPVVKQVFQKEFPVYLIVSTIEPRKNHKYLLEVFNDLWKSGYEIGLCFMGRIGWKVDELMDTILSHPELEKKLFMFNEASDADVEFGYKNAKGFLFPSIIEGFGLPIIEGLQRGLPVFASGTKIHKEVGKDMVQYFDLNEPASLKKIILEHLSNAERYRVNQDQVKIVNWSESASWLWKEIVT